MSKGFGARQRAILARLGDEPTTSCRLRWELAEAEPERAFEGRAAKGWLRDGRIRGAFNSSHARALNRLEAEGAIRVTPRKLQSLDELIAHFPFKTLRLDLHDLRLRLLPLLQKVKLDPLMKGYRDYSEPERERHLIEQLRQDESPELRRLVRSWPELEQRLLSHMAKLDDSKARRHWVQLLAKCEEFLRPKRHIRCSTSLGVLIARCEEQGGPDPDGLLAAVRAGYDACLPREQRDHTALKNQLYRYVHLGDRESVTLHKEVAYELMRLEPQLIAELEGHQPGETRNASPLVPAWFVRDPKQPPGVPYVESFSPDLDRLIDRHCLDVFKFVTRNTGSDKASHAGRSSVSIRRHDKEYEGSA